MALSDATRGMQGAIQQQLLRRMQEQQILAQAAEQQRRAQMETRSADRADASLALQAEQFDAGQARQGRLDQEAAQQHTATQATALGDQIPPDTFMEAADPAAGTMQRGGLGSLLQKQDPTLPMGEDFAGPMPNAETPQQAQVGRPGGFLKTRSQKQLDTDADNARMAQTVTDTRADKTRDDARREAQDVATAEYRAATLAKPSGQGQNTGWTVQQVSDPKTNKTSLMRVNSRTGETQPVALPNGVQPGGQRQTRLTSGQQDDLSTMKTIEDLSANTIKMGNETNWEGVGGFKRGTIAQFGAKNLGTGTVGGQKLRNNVGNILATIAKLRGGTSFTAGEQKLLESYTPTIDDDPKMIQSKLESLAEFIAIKRKNTMQFAGADMGAGTDAETPEARMARIRKAAGL